MTQNWMTPLKLKICPLPSFQCPSSSGHLVWPAVASPTAPSRHRPCLIDITRRGEPGSKSVPEGGTVRAGRPELTTATSGCRSTSVAPSKSRLLQHKVAGTSINTSLDITCRTALMVSISRHTCAAKYVWDCRVILSARALCFTFSLI